MKKRKLGQSGLEVSALGLGDRTVHENCDPDTGEGTSDDYDHWGALLGSMTFLEGNRE